MVVQTVSDRVFYGWSPNLDATPRTGIITVGSGAASATFTLTQSGFTPTLRSRMSFVPITPCRLVDTRESNMGEYGRPSLAAGVERAFSIHQSRHCGILYDGSAFALNITVVPKGPLGYLTVWPTGLPQPLVSTLNSIDGRVKANAAIVHAGASALSISIFATDNTDLVIDVTGYFQTGTPASALAFYPLAPCRVLDTRGSAGELGGPILSGGSPRSFPVRSSACGVPATARAYSLNATVVPPGPLGYLTLWPKGQAQPFVSTLNAPTGSVVANAAIIPAGPDGAISAYASDPTHLVVDINGYFAPAGAPGALLYTAVTPCRILDTRGPAGQLSGPILAASQIRSWPLPASACGLPSSAGAYSLNATVVPTAGLGYLTMWPAGQAQPFVSTLNAADDPIVANALIVPAGAAGAVSSFATNPTHLVIDVNGYFAP